MNKEYTYMEVQELHQKGYSIREIAHITGMSKSSVGRIVQKLRNSASGTVQDACPTTVPGTVSQPVPGTGKAAVGTMQNSQISEPAHAVANQKDTQQEDFALEQWAFAMLMKDTVGTGHWNFLHNIDIFLGSNHYREESALSQYKSWQESVGRRIRLARRHCASCQKNYDGLFMAYVLERLHAYFGQEPELDKNEHPYLSQIRIMKDPFIELLLEQGKKADVFALRQDYVALFPDVHRR